MTSRSLFAIGLILLAVSAGWWALGTSVQTRTTQLDNSLSAEMASLWGPKVLAQGSPYLASRPDANRTEAGAASPASSKLTVGLKLEHRYKGLLWYSTFLVDFTGEYTFPATGAPRVEADHGGQAARLFIFQLPQGVTTYGALSVTVDGQPAPVTSEDIRGGRIGLRLGGAGEHQVAVHYATGGQDAWLYSPGDPPRTEAGEESPVILPTDRLNELQDFSLTVTTDFADIDYPRGTMSPTQRAEPATAGGMHAAWKYPHLITAKAMGIVMPHRPNAGPIAARMSFFAPVSLLFFFTVLLTVVILKAVRLHPMHYLFIAAGFFAFHILMAYLADIVNIHAAFWISAGVSVFLVASYMRLVAGVKFALAYTGLAQLVFLVGFSYAFFFVGRTGLTVTICAIVTLFVLMQATGRVDWHAVFDRGQPQSPPVLPPSRPTTLMPAEH
jgi:hypothetical protein